MIHMWIVGASFEMLSIVFSFFFSSLQETHETENKSNFFFWSFLRLLQMLLTPIMEASEKLLFCFFVYDDDLSLYKLNTFFLNTENKDKQKKSREHTSTKKKGEEAFLFV